MEFDKIMRQIAEHIKDTTNEIDKKNVQEFINSIKKANRVFLYGAGRSGLVSQAFAMRLVQLGLASYVIGETVTPGLKKGDLMIVVSGSGETKLVLSAVKTAKEMGVKIATITSYPKSTLGHISDIIVQIRGKERVEIEKDHLKHQIEGVHSSLTPLGTLFEDTTLVFLDGIIGRLMLELKKDEGEMKRRHASI